MTDMSFLFGSRQFNLTANEFCSKFALVIDQGQDPDEQVAVKLLKGYLGYDKGDEYCLDENEQKSVFNCLGIKVTIPKKKPGNSAGRIDIGGNVSGGNIVMGNGNTCNLTLKDGNKLTTIISGNGVEVTNE